MKFILAKKLNMSQVFSESGEKFSVTVLQAGPCRVVQVKTADRDGYASVQIGFGKKKRLDMAQKGHQKNESFRFLREFPVTDPKVYKVGQEFGVGDFAAGEYVDATGIMKGRGFTGAMKRHGFHGAPASHGHDHPRAVGSIGSRFPQHTLKGTRMAGRMGGHAVTVKNLMVLDADPQKNYLIVKGAVPGAAGGLVKIRTTGKISKAEVKLFNPSALKKSHNEESQMLPVESVQNVVNAGQSDEVLGLAEKSAES